MENRWLCHRDSPNQKNMTPDIWKALGALAALGVLILTAYYKKSDEKRKSIEDEDKKIDSLGNADDIMRQSGELRDK